MKRAAHTAQDRTVRIDWANIWHDARIWVFSTEPERKDCVVAQGFDDLFEKPRQDDSRHEDGFRRLQEEEGSRRHHLFSRGSHVGISLTLDARVEDKNEEKRSAS